jgi:ABC-2 type transport system permease protein
MIVLSGVARPSAAPLVVLAIVCSTAVCVATAVLFSCVAFWMGRVETAARQLADWLVTFSLYPDSLFGGPMRLLLFTLVPAGFVGYVPARVVRSPSLAAVLELVGAAIIYVAAACWVFARGLRRYSAGSRFELVG